MNDSVIKSLEPMVKAGRAEWVKGSEEQTSALGSLFFKCCTFEDFDFLMYDYGFAYISIQGENSQRLTIYYKDISEVISHLSIQLYSEASRKNTPYIMLKMDISAIEKNQIEFPLVIYSQVLIALNEAMSI